MTPEVDTVAEIDFDSYYAVDGYRGTAFYLLGYVEQRETECPGHPAEDCGEAGEGCAIGDVLYCDGSCLIDAEPYPDREWVRAVMVGDDREHEIHVDDLRKIDREAFCGECGQIGCGHDGLERD